MFYDNFVNLCNAVGKSPSAVAVEIGFQKSVVTRWKQNNSTPTDANLKKIADYFGVETEAIVLENNPVVEVDVTLANIYGYMKQYHLSQKELAKYLGITSATITGWRYDKSKSYRQYLPKIAELLDVSVDEIYGIEDKKKFVTENGDEPDIEVMVQRLNFLMEKRSLTNYQLAKELDVHPTTIANWRHGMLPRKKTLLQLSKYFGVTVAYLEGKEQNEAPTQKDERGMTDSDLKFALWGDSDITDDDLADVRRYAAFIKERQKGEGK